LTDALRKAERKSPAGRKPLDVILMFKALIIQRLFNLSDEQLEYQITCLASATPFKLAYILFVPYVGCRAWCRTTKMRLVSS
jgi:hypothetical protein